MATKTGCRSDDFEAGSDSACPEHRKPTYMTHIFKVKWIFLDAVSTSKRLVSRAVVTGIYNKAHNVVRCLHRSSMRGPFPSRRVRTPEKLCKQTIRGPEKSKNIVPETSCTCSNASFPPDKPKHVHRIALHHIHLVQKTHSSTTTIARTAQGMDRYTIFGTHNNYKLHYCFRCPSTLVCFLLSTIQHDENCRTRCGILKQAATLPF